MMKDERRKKQLGMPIGTAGNRLRKMLLFHLAQLLKLDVCFRCAKRIETVEEFSIEHKQPWENVNPALFWDLNNVAFSHLSCNIKCALKVNAFKKGHAAHGEMIVPPGHSWCSRCRQPRPLNEFNKNASKKNGVCSECRSCQHQPYLES